MVQSPNKKRYGKILTGLLACLMILTFIQPNKEVFDLNLNNETEDNSLNNDFMDDLPYKHDLIPSNEYSGVGKPWDVKHWANRTDRGLEVSFTNGSSDNSQGVRLYPGWEGTNLTAEVNNLIDTRNWCNGSFQFGDDYGNYDPDVNDSDTHPIINNNKYQNWTFHHDGADYNDKSGNYIDSTSATYNDLEGHDCLELRMDGVDLGGGDYQYGGSIYTSWRSTFKIPRGELIDAMFYFEVSTYHVVELDTFEIQILINNQKIQSYGVFSLNKTREGRTWINRSLPFINWLNRDNIFPEGPLQDNDVEIEIRLKHLFTGAVYYESTDPGKRTYQQVFIDNVKLITKAETKPSFIDLRVNKTKVKDLNDDWGLGRITLNASIEEPWKGNHIYANFTSFQEENLSLYEDFENNEDIVRFRIEFNVDLILYAIQNEPETYYDTTPNAYGTNFHVSNDSKVLWDCFIYGNASTGYVEDYMTVRFPTDVNITEVYQPLDWETNILDQCNNKTPGILKLNVSEITNSPNSYWILKGRSPNYCRELNIYNNQSGNWKLNSTFLSGDYINITGRIKNSTEIKNHILNTRAKLQIRFPNGSIWHQIIQFDEPDKEGIIKFEPFQIPFSDDYNYSVGTYQAIITWNNSHSGFGINETGIIYKEFYVVHESILYPENNDYYKHDIIENSTVTLKVYYKDAVSVDPIKKASVYTYRYDKPGIKQYFSEVGDGFYRLVFNVSGAELGYNNLTIYASSPDFQEKQFNFTLYVIKPSNLKVDESILSVEWRSNFSIQFNYTTLNSQLGIDTNPIYIWTGGDAHLKQIGLGEYNLTCNTSLSQVNSFESLSIKLNKTGYQYQELTITIEILERETYISDIYLNRVDRTDEQSASLKIKTPLNITVKYRDKLTDAFIYNSSINVTTKDLHIDKQFNESKSLLFYNTTLNSSKLGIGSSFLTVVAKQENYSLASVELTISVYEINSGWSLLMDKTNVTTLRTIKKYTNQTLNITVRYRDEDNNHIPGADVYLEGIVNDEFLEVSSRENYTIEINTSKLEQGVNFFTIRINKTSYEPQTIDFSVEMLETSTNITLFLNESDETADRSIEVIIGQSIFFNVSYKVNKTFAHITDSIINLKGSGLDLNLKENKNRKYYWVEINSTDLDRGINILELYAYKVNYEPQTLDQIEIKIIDKRTRMDLLLNDDNKTDDLDKFIILDWNEELNITIKYKNNDTGDYIPSALVKITGNINLDPYPDLKQYSIIINTRDLGIGSTSFTVTAEKENYDTQTFNFRVEVNEREVSIDKLLLNQAEVTFLDLKWNTDVNITAFFRDSKNSSYIILGDANITSPALSIGLDESIPSNHYSIELNTIELGIGTHYFTLQFVREGYATISKKFTIKVSERETDFRLFLNNIEKKVDLSVSLFIGNDLDISIKFTDNISGSIINNAQIQVSGEDLNNNLEIAGNYYNTTISSRELGIGVKFLTIYCYKQGFEEISEIIKISISRMRAEIQTENGTSTVNILPGETVNLKLELNNLNLNTKIKNASVSYIWELGEGIIEDKNRDGIYELTLENVPEGTYTIYIIVNLTDDFEIERYQITLNVVRPEGEALLYQILTIIGVSAAIGLTGYLIAYQKLLKYPKPVRKVRKFKKKYKKEEVVLKDDEIISRKDSFKELFNNNLAPVAKDIAAKLKQTETKSIEKIKPGEDSKAEEINLKTQEKITKEGGETSK